MSLTEHVAGQVDHVHVAGPLAVAEERAFDAVCAGHDAELGSCHGRAAIVVRVQGQDHGVTPGHVAVEPFNRIAVDVRGIHLHRGRQVEDDRPLRRRLDDVHHRGANLDRVVELRPGEALRRVLVTNLRARYAGLLLEAHLGRVDCDLRHAFPVQAEDDAPLQHGRRVVEVDDRPLRALEALVRSLDQLAAALRQDLDRDVVRDQVFLDELADEVEVRLRRGREADLDLLEAHSHQGPEHAQLATRVHRIDEGLVAVAQVDGAPNGRLLDLAVRPLAVRKAERQGAQGHVLLDRHLLGVGWFGRHLLIPSWSLGWSAVVRCGMGGLVGETKTSCLRAGGQRRAPNGARLR
jgi:hypothetical protein